MANMERNRGAMTPDKTPELPAADQKPEREPARGSLIRGLSGKLLVLTVLFVMIAEVFIFVPSIANFRVNWLRQRLAAAQIASLVLEATPDNMISKKLTTELLKNAQSKTIALKRGGTRKLVLDTGENPVIEEHFDLREKNWMKWIWDAFKTLAASDGRIIRVVDTPGFEAGEFIDIVIDEKPLRTAMVAFSFNILRLSIIISLITAALVFIALHGVLVRPMRRLTENMVRYSHDPEDTRRIIEPTGRRDEIGVAEHELAQMQKELAGTLQQKNHLAALGLAVSKVSHDLRNMLATTQLLSDRLGEVDDPTVKRIAPKLLGAIDRAIEFCNHTLRYGKAQEQTPRRSRFALRGLVDEVLESIGPCNTPVKWTVSLASEVTIDADRSQMYRVLLNLCRNAVQAFDTLQPDDRSAVVEIAAHRAQNSTIIEVHDNGPGLPARAREHLFEAFHGSARAGGTGLGLAIAAELVRAHQGDIALVDSPLGACFRIVIPDLVAEVPNARDTSRSA